jgi:osmotically inducible protein OsmC
MPTQHARASWSGSLSDGSGHLSGGSGLEAVYDVPSRFEDGKHTNPEEVLGASLAGCYAMALTLHLEEAGHEPSHVAADATVRFDTDDLRIGPIQLTIEIDVPDLAGEDLTEFAQTAKETCPVSIALESVDISLDLRS